MEFAENISRKFKNLHFRYFFDKNKKTTLLFLHGLTGTSAVWDEYANSLKKYYNIILVDLIGHGKSDSPQTLSDYHFKTQAQKIAEWLRSQNITRLSIISYSYSCNISRFIELDSDLNIESIAYISPYFKQNFNLPAKLFFKFTKLIWQFLIPNKKLNFDYAHLQNYENPGWRDNRYILKCMNTKDLLGSIYALQNQSNISDWKSNKIPLLIICGEHDPIINTPTIKSLIGLDNTELKIITNKKHLFLKTDVNRVTDILQSFLTKHTSAVRQ